MKKNNKSVTMMMIKMDEKFDHVYTDQLHYTPYLDHVNTYNTYCISMKTRLYYLTNKRNQVISLSSLKDMIRYKHFVPFSIATSKNEFVNIFSATSVSIDHTIK